MVNSERPRKLILVSIWYRGQLNWALVSALKQGRHYVISPEAYDALLTKASVHPHTTFTLG